MMHAFYWIKIEFFSWFTSQSRKKYKYLNLCKVESESNCVLFGGKVEKIQFYCFRKSFKVFEKFVSKSKKTLFVIHVYFSLQNFQHFSFIVWCTLQQHKEMKRMNEWKRFGSCLCFTHFHRKHSKHTHTQHMISNAMPF